MKSIIQLVVLFTSFCYAQNGVNQPFGEIGSEPSVPNIVTEKFNENGTYEKYVNNNLVAKGTHINKLLNGELTKYNGLQIVEITNYKLGKKHGKSILKVDGSEFDYNSRFDEVTFYENDVISGYKYHITPAQDTVYKFGPFNEKQKKENRIVQMIKLPYVKGQTDLHNLEYIVESVFIFKSGALVEQDNKYFLLKGNEKREINHLTTYYETDGAFHYSKVKNEHSLIPSELGKIKSEKCFNTKGKLFYSNTTDSITYYLNEFHRINTYFSPKIGQVKFKSITDKGIKVCESILQNDGSTFIVSYYNEVNGDLLYKVQSVEDKDLKIDFAADSLQKYYHLGEFVGIDGKKHYFDLNGNISKSQSQFEVKYEYKEAINGSFVYQTYSSIYVKDYMLFEFKKSGVVVNKKRLELSNDTYIEKTIESNEALLFQKDSAIYVVYKQKASEPFAIEEFVFKKFILRDNKLYLVFPGTAPLISRSLEDILSYIPRDSIYPICLPLVPLTEFKPETVYKELETASKEELEQLFKELDIYYQQLLMLDKSVAYDFSKDYFHYSTNDLKQLFFFLRGYNPKGSLRAIEFHLETIGFKSEEVVKYMSLLKFSKLREL